MPTVSLCMIVKNEEQFLEKCLNSVKDLVDEIIIVDTGSADKTKVIASKFTDKIFDFEWCDDFSAARNESLKHATGDWILVLDADEVISKEDHEQIRKLVKEEKAVGYVLQQRNYVKNKEDLGYGSVGGVYVKEAGQGKEGFISSQEDKYEESKNTLGWFYTPIVRLFRNENPSFSGVVHEDISPSLSGEMIFTEIPIHHFGKLDRDARKKKWEFYEQLAEKKAAEEKDYYAYFELGRQYLENKKIEPAKEMFLKSISLKSDFWVTWFNVGGIYLINNELDLAVEYLETARKLNPQAVQVYSNLGVVYAKKKEFQKAIDSFVAGLKLNPNQPGVYKNMALCYNDMGDKERAIMAYRKFAELSQN